MSGAYDIKACFLFLVLQGWGIGLCSLESFSVPGNRMGELSSERLSLAGGKRHLRMAPAQPLGARSGAPPSAHSLLSTYRPSPAHAPRAGNAVPRREKTMDKHRTPGTFKAPS